ncbi:gamma subclass chorismate mutase AroQ [Kribbella sandramycini]|nr:gamma subclass chorismate mutase AroQ [Kribbella sandramycini]
MILVVAVVATGQVVTPAFASEATVAVAPARVGFAELTELVVRRIEVGDRVAASKYFSGRPVDDPVREQQILTAVRAEAIELGIDPEETADFFRAQIEASKVVQRGLLKRWAAHPDEVPTTGPDLDAVRRELDQLTTDLLAELVVVDQLRNARPHCQIELLLATIPAAAPLDRLHRKAFKVGTETIC